MRVELPGDVDIGRSSLLVLVCRKSGDESPKQVFELQRCQQCRGISPSVEKHLPRRGNAEPRIQVRSCRGGLELGWWLP